MPKPMLDTIAGDVTAVLTFGEGAHDQFRERLEEVVDYTVAVLLENQPFQESGGFITGQDYRVVEVTDGGLLVLDLDTITSEPVAGQEPHLIPWVDIRRVHVY